MGDSLSYLDNLLTEISPLARCMSAYTMASCACTPNNLTLDSHISSSVHRVTAGRAHKVHPSVQQRANSCVQLKPNGICNFALTMSLGIIVMIL